MRKLWVAGCLLVVVAVVASTVGIFCSYGSGYATQVAADPTTYRLDDEDGKLVAYVFTQPAPSRGKIGTMPKEGQLTHNWRAIFTWRSSGIVFYDLEVFCSADTCNNLTQCVGKTIGVMESASRTILTIVCVWAGTNVIGPLHQ